MSPRGTTARPRGWRTHIGVALAVASIAVAVPIGRILPVGASAEATVDTETWYVLVNRHSGKALEVSELDISDGAEIIQSTRSDEPSQQWQFMQSVHGDHQLRNQYSNKFLDVFQWTTDDGGAVVQWSDVGRDSQHWQVLDAGDGYVQLINRRSGRAVDVLDWSTEDGADVVEWTGHGGANQQWKLVPVGSAEYPEPEPLSGDLGVHDPSVVARPAGDYLLASTGPDIGLKTSSDRVAWTDVGTAFPDGAPWTYEYTGGDRVLWAPDLSYHDGTYYLFYSASAFGSQKSAIFLATSTTGEPGSWEDRGLVIESHGGDDFNAIDPNLLVDDDGRWWLSFGSYWSGIKMVELDPATGMRLDDTIVSIANRNNGVSTNVYYGSIEAPYIVKRDTYYYLYASFDHCCAAASSDYRIMVGRSTEPTGPYVDRYGTPMMQGGGTEILAGHDDINGPGHQAVLSDTDGDVLFYHYYPDSGQGPTECGYCSLGINRIGYDADGWPYVH